MSETEEPTSKEHYDPILGALVVGTTPIIELNHVVGITVMADRAAIAALDGEGALKEAVSKFCSKNGFPVRDDYKTAEMKHIKFDEPDNIKDILHFNLKFDEPYTQARKPEIEQLAAKIDKIPGIMFGSSIAAVAEETNTEWQKKVETSHYLPALENVELIKAGAEDRYSAIEVTARVDWLPTLRDKMAFASAVGDFMSSKGCTTRLDSHSTLNAPIRSVPNHPPEFVFIFPVDSESGGNKSKMLRLQQELAAIPKTGLSSGNVEL